MTEQQQQQQQQQQQEPQPQPTTDNTSTILLLVFLGIWLIISIWAIIKALLCTGKSGSTVEKILGILIAFFMGPFYFLYQYANKNYCLDDESAPTSAPASAPAQSFMSIGGKRKHK